jgi:hypothetical protein
VAIGAAIAQRPGVGGHTWVALQWMLGFRALGWEPVLVDRLENASPAGVAYLARTMESFGLDWVVQEPSTSRRELGRRLDGCELLVNVMGYLDPELTTRFPVRVFLDIDPGFGQMWRALGLADVFDGHDRFVTVGTNLGGEGCTVPDVGLSWEPTLPPVALDVWPAVPDGRDVTSVVTWRGPFGPIEYNGRTYGLRVHEFRRFFELPRRTGARFRIALDIDPADAADRDALHDHGWELLDPRAAAGDPSAYREFVQGSAAELCVAKQLYVATRGGWFSDRSACYLASGKPVVAQDTGFGVALPTGEGLLAFASPEQAADGLRAVLHDRPLHARAARRLAEEHLAADRVVSRLLERIGAA